MERVFLMRCCHPHNRPAHWLEEEEDELSLTLSHNYNDLWTLDTLLMETDPPHNFSILNSDSQQVPGTHLVSLNN